VAEGGYIKINRGILEWEWYGNINTKVLFLHMLIKANWKEGKFQGIDIPRGSFVSSYPKLSDELGLTVNEIRTALKHLQSTEEITVKAYSKFSVFTVNNYCSYQDINSQSTDNSQADNSQSTVKAQSINSQLTTIEERKKERREEGKNERNNIYVANPETASATFPPDSFEMVCVEKLIKSVIEQFQGAKVPDTTAAKIKWCEHIEKMKRLDHRTEAEIQEVLKFAITDQFWKTNIRSTKTLREKFDTLIMQSRKHKGTGAAKSKPNQFQSFPQREIDYDALVLQQLQEG
jgi:DNA-binding transcriptional MerR regulator